MTNIEIEDIVKSYVTALKGASNSNIKQLRDGYTIVLLAEIASLLPEPKGKNSEV